MTTEGILFLPPPPVPLLPPQLHTEPREVRGSLPSSTASRVRKMYLTRLLLSKCRFLHMQALVCLPLWATSPNVNSANINDERKKNRND